MRASGASGVSNEMQEVRAKVVQRDVTHGSDRERDESGADVAEEERRRVCELRERELGYVEEWERRG